MIRSMTGFGRASCSLDGAPFDVEVKCVNHRYLDARVRLPRLISSLEPELRARVQRRFKRGKVDVSVTTPEGSVPAPRLEVDLEVARGYLRAADELRSSEQLSGQLEIGALLALPGVATFSEPRLQVAELGTALGEAVDEALTAADAMRETEGAALARELLSRLGSVAALTDAIEARAGLVQDTVRERLRKRAEQLGRETGLMDEARLHQEIVIAADRLDITEETVRLRSHIAQFREILASAGADTPVGRRLDFLLQELGRETNTIGSKGADAPIAHQIVELKAELERLREQVQNVE